MAWEESIFKKLSYYILIIYVPTNFHSQFIFSIFTWYYSAAIINILLPCTTAARQRQTSRSQKFLHKLASVLIGFLTTMKKSCPTFSFRGCILKCSYDVKYLWGKLKLNVHYDFVFIYTYKHRWSTNQICKQWQWVENMPTYAYNYCK